MGLHLEIQLVFLVAHQSSVLNLISGKGMRADKRIYSWPKETVERKKKSMVKLLVRINIP